MLRALGAGYDLLKALGSASCDFRHETDETGGTICAGHWHWVLRLVISHTKPAVSFCVLSYHTRDKGYDLFLSLGSAFCDIIHETGSFYGHWVLVVLFYPTRSREYDWWRDLGSAVDLRLVISHTRQGVRVFTGIGFCVL